MYSVAFFHSWNSKKLTQFLQVAIRFHSGHRRPKRYSHRWGIVVECYFSSRVLFTSLIYSLRKRPTFHDDTTGIPAKWRLSKDRRNFLLITFTTQIWVVVLIGRSNFLSRLDQSGALTRSGSSVTNFCSRFSDIILLGSRRWRRKMSAVFSGYLTPMCFQAIKTILRKLRHSSLN